MIIKYIYTIFLGILIAVFVGEVVTIVYPQPTPPSAPPFPVGVVNTPLPSGPSTVPPATTPEEQKLERTWNQQADQQQRDYQVMYQHHIQNVMLITLGLAIVLLAMGLTLFQSTSEISDGILFSGILMLLYSLAMSFSNSQPAQNELYRLSVMTVALAIGFILGYIKFVRPERKKS